MRSFAETVGDAGACARRTVGTVAVAATVFRKSRRERRSVTALSPM
jgi:hypothetical protein